MQVDRETRIVNVYKKNWHRFRWIDTARPQSPDLYFFSNGRSKTNLMIEGSRKTELS